MNQNLLTGWINDELATMRTEGVAERKFLEPSTLACVFVNVLATHVDEFLKDQSLVKGLKKIFEQRGLTGQAWFTTMVGLGMEMSQEQLPILGWLMEREPGSAQALWSDQVGGEQAN